MISPAKVMTLFALSGACCVGMLWAQQDDAKPNSSSAASTNSGARVDTVRTRTVNLQAPAAAAGVATAPADRLNTTVASVYRAEAAGRSQSSVALNKAIKAYRDSKVDSAERREAREKVSSSLSTLYDEHLADQEKQIAALAERLDKLRGQLVKRKDAKARMVELKLEMVLSQADGLGWPDEGAARARGLSGTTDWFIQSDDVSAFPPATRYQQVLEVGPNGEEIEIVRPLLSLPASPVAPVAPAAPATPGSDPFR
jgi:hypothetical protein